MGKSDDKPAEVKQAEQTGGESYTPEVEKSQTTKPATPPANQCPDCEGRGIRNPDIDHQVCQTCEGRGTLA